MARPIAYSNSHPLSGSITQQQGGGLISYTVDGAGRDYSSFAGKKWVPSADGAAPIIFVTDSFTQGFSTQANSVPLFYACAGTSSAAILYTANHLPGSPGNYATVNDAITDLLSNDWFIIEGEEPFEGIDADNMVLDLDPSKLNSYPGTGTAWYDISGKNNASSLINGPTFNSGGWIEMDGIDDYAVGPGGISGEDCTVELWISSSDYSGHIPLSINGDAYSSGPNIYFTSGVITWNTGDGAGNPFAGSSYPDTKWHHIMIINDFNGTAGYGQAVLFIDGTQIGFATPLNATTTQGGSKFWVGRFHGGSYNTPGKYKAARIYNEALSEARVKQNYFGSNIVTDGMIFMVDANNIVSYQKSGTTAYNLTGSNTLTLYNGLGYKQGYGGYFDVDGTDDAMTTPDAANLDIANNFTVEGWVWWNRHKDYASLLVKGPGGSGQLFNYSFFFYANDIKFGFGDGGSYISVNINTSVVPTNTWHHIMGTYDGSNLKFYLNGELKGTAASSATPNQNNDALNVIQASYPIDGRIASARVYNRALSAAEVLQNYQAEQYRFEGPAGVIETGLVVHLDAMNLESYPGSGNTWYDLSGNGNNATKNGATGNPTWEQATGWTFYASVNGVNGGLTIANSATIQNLTATTVFLVVAMETKSVISGDSDWMAIYSKWGSDQRIAISVNQVARYLHIEVPAATNSAAIFNNADYTGTKFNIMAARVGASGTTGWVNGTQVSTSAYTTTGNTGPIYLGHDVNNEMFKGSMKAALTYNRALSDDEMVQMFDYLNKKFSVY